MLGLTVAERVTVSPTFNWMDVLSMDMDTTSICSGPTFLQAENEKRRNASDRKSNASHFTRLPTLLRYLPAQFSIIFSNIVKLLLIKVADFVNSLKIQRLAKIIRLTYL